MFPVIHSLLDAKITNVLSLCHDKTILAAVQSIIENMVSCEDTSQQQLHFLQSCGFGGLWRFAGPFTKSNCNSENVELFVNCLEALVETCLPQDEADHELNQYPSMLSVSSIAVSSNIKLSSSLTSISMASPTERAANNPFWIILFRNYKTFNQKIYWCFWHKHIFTAVVKVKLLYPK